MEKEKVKKAGDSNSSEPKPRKRDAKADRKNVYNTSCNSPNSDFVIGLKL